MMLIWVSMYTVMGTLIEKHTLLALVMEAICFGFFEKGSGDRTVEGGDVFGLFHEVRSTYQGQPSLMVPLQSSSMLLLQSSFAAGTTSLVHVPHLPFSQKRLPALQGPTPSVPDAPS